MFFLSQDVVTQEPLPNWIFLNLSSFAIQKIILCAFVSFAIREKAKNHLLESFLFVCMYLWDSCLLKLRSNVILQCRFCLDSFLFISGEASHYILRLNKSFPWALKLSAQYLLKLFFPFLHFLLPCFFFWHHSKENKSCFHKLYILFDFELILLLCSMFPLLSYCFICRKTSYGYVGCFFLFVTVIAIYLDNVETNTKKQKKKLIS